MARRRSLVSDRLHKKPQDRKRKLAHKLLVELLAYVISEFMEDTVLTSRNYSYQFASPVRW